MENKRKIQMWKNGEWVEWDGSDVVNQLLITEYITLKQFKKDFPEEYKKLLSKLK